MAELADAADSKSAGLRPLGVRLPLPAPKASTLFSSAYQVALSAYRFCTLVHSVSQHCVRVIVKHYARVRSRRAKLEHQCRPQGGVAILLCREESGH